MKWHVSAVLVTACLVLTVSVPVMADDAMLQQLQWLDQLDQLDQQDFDDALERAYSCTDARDISCAKTALNEAESLIDDPASRQRVVQARDYLATTEQMLAAEAERVAQRQREQACIERCPREREYQQCLAGQLNANRCRDLPPPKPKNSGPSTLQMFSMALSDVQRQMQHDLEQQRIAMQREQEAYARQRAEQERRQRERAEALARRAEAHRAEQEAAEQAQQARRDQLARERARQEAEQQRAQQREQRAQARQLAAAQRQQQREAERQAKSQREQAYLNALRQGAQLRGRGCYGEKHVFGVLPAIQPEEIACVNVEFAVYCPGGSAPVHKGVVDNMVSNTQGSCFGDTEAVPSSLPCKASEFRVVATQVRGC